MKRNASIYGALAALVLLYAGCTPAIQTRGEEDISSIPASGYTAYFYSSGSGESLRTAFLKSPGSAIEIVPDPDQTIKSPATLNDALSFMEKGGGNRDVAIQEVDYNGNRIGYLITYAHREPFLPRTASTWVSASGAAGYTSTSGKHVLSSNNPPPALDYCGDGVIN